MADEKRDTGITLIAIGKWLKALGLIAVGVLAIAASKSDTHALLGSYADWFRIDPHNRYLVRAISKISGMDKHRLHEIGIGTFVYAALFLVEGTGLWFKKHWAEWLTIAITTSFIPLEVYELVKEPSAGKVVALVLNVAAVIYLLWHRLRKQQGSSGKRASARFGWLPQTGG